MSIDMDAVIARLREGWTKGEFVTDAGKVCLLGACLSAHGWAATAIRDVHAEDLAPYERALSPVIREQFADRLLSPRDPFPVTNFNDHPDTTLDDVIAVCEKARAEQ